MPRRIIYLKNPTAGSHFRTLGGASPRPPSKPRTSKPKPPPGTWVSSTGTHYKAAQPDWAIGNQPGYNPADFDNWYPGPPTINLPDRGVPYYEMEDIDTWAEPESIWTQFILIAQGVDPFTGKPIPMWGEPGWTSFQPLGMDGDQEGPYTFGKPREAGLPQNRLYWLPGKGIIKGRPK